MVAGALPQLELNGRVYTFKNIPATKAVTVLLPLARALAPSLVRAAAVAATMEETVKQAVKGAVEGGKDLKELKPSDVLTVEQQVGQIKDMGDAVALLFEKLDELSDAKRSEVLRIVFGSVICPGLPALDTLDAIDAAFAGKFDDFGRVFVQALSINFAPFLPEKVLASFRGVGAMFSGSNQPTSTGTSSPPS